MKSCNFPLKPNSIQETTREESSSAAPVETVFINQHEHTHHGHSHAHSHIVSKPDSVSSVAWMVIFGDGIHNMADGMAIGAAFGESYISGISTSIAVLCHVSRTMILMIYRVITLINQVGLKIELTSNQLFSF